jgi:hypothetical protein
MGEPVPIVLQTPCPGCMDDLPDVLLATLTVPDVMDCNGSLIKVGMGIYSGVLDCTGDGMANLTIAFCDAGPPDWNSSSVENLAWKRLTPPPTIQGICGSDIAWGAGCIDHTGFLVGGCPYWIQGVCS